MPAQPAWLLRIPQILEQLRALEAPVLDRALLEQLFSVGRRRAIQLMACFGGYQAGRTYLLDRLALIAALERVSASERYRFEERRKQRLTGELERVRRDQRARQVLFDPGRPAETSDALPPGVHLQPGRLIIEFQGATDLLSRLYHLGQAAAQDWEGFRAAAEGEPQIEPWPVS